MGILVGVGDGVGDDGQFVASLVGRPLTRGQPTGQAPFPQASPKCEDVTTLRTISQPFYLRRQQEERDSHGARGTDEIQDQHKSNTTGLRPSGPPGVLVGAENPVTLCDLGIFLDQAAEPVPRGGYPDGAFMSGAGAAIRVYSPI